MASNKYIIKIKTEVGTFTIELTEESTVKDLKCAISQKTKFPVENLKLLYGYPPKALSNNRDSCKLSEVNILSGDTVIVEKQKEQVVPDREKKDDFMPTADFGVVMRRQDPPLNNDPNRIQLSSILPPQELGVMMRQDVPSNNSCLFTSIQMILSNGHVDTSQGDELRKIIAQRVAANPVKYNTAFLGMPNQAYCAWILDNKNWGGAIELAILSEHLQLEIAVVNTSTVKMHCFGENDNYEKRVFLIYDGIHYDPLVLEFFDSRQYVFLRTDNTSKDMALEIAREAKSSQQFTDIASCSILCKDCNKHFKGEREVTKHAMESGHRNFDQELQ